MSVPKGSRFISKGDIVFNTVIIIGVGLIGSSIGMNLITRRLAREVIGVGRSRKNLQVAIRRRAIHRAVGAQFIAPLLANLSVDDLIILATPVGEIRRYLQILPRGPLITDVGSTKLSIVKKAERQRLRFIGSHPIAGTEKIGASSGERDLFRKRQCLLTPSRYAKKTDLETMGRFWKLLGCQVSQVDAGRHDRILAAVSHLPHVSAYALVGTVSKLVPLSSSLSFALGGFKGTTRVAASSPSMWRDIFLDNRNLLGAIGRYQKEIGKLKSYIIKRDVRGLTNYLRSAQLFRLKFS